MYVCEMERKEANKMVIDRLTDSQIIEQQAKEGVIFLMRTTSCCCLDIYTKTFNVCFILFIRMKAANRIKKNVLTLHHGQERVDVPKCKV